MEVYPGEASLAGGDLVKHQVTSGLSPNAKPSLSFRKHCGIDCGTLMRFPCSRSHYHFVLAHAVLSMDFSVVYVVHCHVATRLHVNKTWEDLCESHNHQELE